METPPVIAGAQRRLGRHYIPARYPDAHAAGGAAGHYGQEDSDEALRDAREIFAFVDAAWEALNA